MGYSLEFQKCHVIELKYRVKQKIVSTVLTQISIFVVSGPLDNVLFHLGIVRYEMPQKLIF